jgi:hypothetical protein
MISNQIIFRNPRIKNIKTTRFTLIQERERISNQFNFILFIFKF